MSISETEVVLDPCIMVSEEESGTKAMKNTEVHTSGDLASCQLGLSWVTRVTTA